MMRMGVSCLSFLFILFFDNGLQTSFGWNTPLSVVRCLNLLIQLLQYYRRASGDVELEPLLLVALVQGLEVSEVREARVGEAITAKHGVIGIEHLLV